MSAVAYVPGSPLLVPGLGGEADVLADLRQTCLEAIAALGPGPVVILGEAPAAGGYVGGRTGLAALGPAGDVLGWTHHLDDLVGEHLDPLPLSLSVGWWLAAHAGVEVQSLVAVTSGDRSAAVPVDTGLLVVADGSAARGPQAPLPADDRAEPWDDALAAALAAGHLDVDLPLGAGLGATAAAWAAAATLTAGRSWDAQLLAYEAPLGVAYLVATWL